MKRLCVFCGSSTGFDPAHAASARALGAAIARAGMGLVYGGASVGLMGIVADAALEHHAEVIGVLPQALADRELAHDGLSTLHITRSMHERKALMADLSDGFIALPGGIGTLEELFEIWTWGQLGDHAKPVALFDPTGFYAPLTVFLDSIVDAGFLKAEQRAMLYLGRDPDALIAEMREYRCPAMPKWIGDAER